jgi:hypothetical protein
VQIRAELYNIAERRIGHAIIDLPGDETWLQVSMLDQRVFVFVSAVRNVLTFREAGPWHITHKDLLP